jgi:hypothetical protein
MLPDTELICDLSNGMTLCDASWWHMVFLVQSGLVISLGLTNVITGLRYWFGVMTVPLWVARRFTWATVLSAIVPLSTGLFLREKVRVASYHCYLAHDDTGCTHGLMDRMAEMMGVMTWVGWTEAVLVGTCLVGIALLYGPTRPQRR